MQLWWMCFRVDLPKTLQYKYISCDVSVVPFRCDEYTWICSWFLPWQCSDSVFIVKKNIYVYYTGCWCDKCTSVQLAHHGLVCVFLSEQSLWNRNEGDWLMLVLLYTESRLHPGLILILMSHTSIHGLLLLSWVSVQSFMVFVLSPPWLK